MGWEEHIYEMEFPLYVIPIYIQFWLAISD